jgi:tripartite ATP-independent transporter DctM subunit
MNTAEPMDVRDNAAAGRDEDRSLHVPGDLPQTRASYVLDTGITWIGHAVSWLWVVLIAIIVLNVTLRYAFGEGRVELEELQWHLYAVGFLIGFSYCAVYDGHVRVDVFHARFRLRTKAWIELIGLLVFLMPFIWLMVAYSVPFVERAYEIGEVSDAPGGLGARWLIKAALPVSFIILGVAALSRLFRVTAFLFGIPRPIAVSHLRWMQAGEVLVTLLAVVVFLAVVGALLWYGVIGAIVEFATIGLAAVVLWVTQVFALFLDLTFNEILALLMFVGFLALLFTGYPIAWLLGGIAVLFTAIIVAADTALLDRILETFPDYWEGELTWTRASLVTNNTWEQMRNWVLVALPMFIFMGLMLDRSGIAETLMDNFVQLFGRVRGGYAVTITLIGVLLAASTGIIGASVVLLTLLGLPVMLKNGYSKELGVGTCSAVGTLGILIPPSIMLVLMADKLSMSVGDLFMGALIPGIMLGGLYIAYILVLAFLRPDVAPAPREAPKVTPRVILNVLLAVLPPAALILAVLGSIFFGVATPTEASGVGAFGATLLALANRRLSLAVLIDVMRETTKTTAFIFAIIIGAVAFALILRNLGGDEMIERALLGLDIGNVGLILVILLIVFVLGFILDWIQIILIILPLVGPIVQDMGVDLGFESGSQALVWFTVVFAVVLQTSFLTPPVGFALFYVKGVAPPEISVRHIYRGVIPFIIVQLIGVALIFLWPALVTWLPSVAYSQG